MFKLRSLASQAQARLPHTTRRLPFTTCAASQTEMLHRSSASETLYPMTTFLNHVAPVCVLGTAVWAAVQPAAQGWLQPSQLTLEAGVSVAGIALAWAAEVRAGLPPRPSAPYGVVYASMLTDWQVGCSL